MTLPSFSTSGQTLQRVDGRIGGRFLLQRTKVDRHDRHRNPFFRQKNAHTARIGRPAAVIELHAPLLLPRTWSPDIGKSCNKGTFGYMATGVGH
jgi:hypothetical protein